MNAKFEAMRAQVKFMREVKRQLEENQTQEAEGFTIHKSVAELMKHLRDSPNENK